MTAPSLGVTAHLATTGTGGEEYGAGLLGDAALVHVVSAEIGQAAAELVARPLDPVAAAHMRRALDARTALARASLRRLQREPRSDLHNPPTRHATPRLAVVPNGAEGPQPAQDLGPSASRRGQLCDQTPAALPGGPKRNGAEPA